MIQTENLVKKYGDFTAVNGINLNIKAGEIYGFLGPNGAGKTTTTKMLLGINQPTSGHIYLFGQKFTPDRLDLRRRITAVPEKHPIGVWTWMTGFEYLNFFARTYGLRNPKERILSLLKQLELYRFRNRPFKSYSRGMLQKLNIIRALLPDPDILFLDEPISGLDPIGVKLVRDLILEENRDGRCIFVTSHLLSEIEKICKRIGIIYQGQLVAEDSMDVLLNKLVQDREIIIDIEGGTDELVQKIKKLPFVKDCRKDKNSFIIAVGLDKDYRRDLAEYIFKQGFIPIRIEQKSVSLEDAFMSITKEKIKQITEEGGVL